MNDKSFNIAELSDYMQKNSKEIMQSQRAFDYVNKKVQELEKQLSESVPKSKIRELYKSRPHGFPNARKEILKNIAGLVKE